MGNIIAITYIGQRNLLQISVALLQGKVIGQCLAGMLQIAQGVDYRNRGMMRHTLDGLVCECPQHDDVNPALQVMSHVTQLLACVQSALRLIDEHGRSTQAYHSRLECETGSERWLLEEHHHLFSSH